MRKLLGVLVLCANASAQDLPRLNPIAVHYELTYPASGATVIQVEIELPDPLGREVLVMPRAIPMGYGEVPYDEFIDDLEAFTPAGEGVEVRPLAGPRWQLGAEGDVVRRVRYTVDVARMERETLAAADSSKVRRGYVGLLGYSVFAYVEGRDSEYMTLAVSAPPGWPVYTTRSMTESAGFHGALASVPNYYALADAQVILGPKARVQRFGGPGPALYLVAYAECELDMDALGRLGREALDALVDWFGSVPFETYTIILEHLKPVSDEHEYGFSMEHLSSGTFFMGVENAITEGSTERERLRWKYNFAHHIAHSWIPKRCYGEGYFPFSWEKAPILDTIWFSEGFGQYVAIDALARGMEDGDAFRERMLDFRFRSNLAEAPEFLRRMTLVEVSREASTKYSTDFRIGKNVFSRGGMMAAEMDALIRAESEGKSLRDALCHLIAWTGEEERAFKTEELPEILSEGCGIDLRPVFEKWMR